MSDDPSNRTPTPTQISGGAFVPPTVEELQAALPAYEVLEILGAGGMGAVYKARQINLDRLVAIKVLPSHLGADYSFAERFKREAQAMAKMQHPRIVAAHDFGQAELASIGGVAAPEGESKLLYIVMEYVEGTDLDQLIKTSKLKPDQILAIVTQICDALQYAHDKGIVHRDIKPANIMLDVDGMVKVADFGLAKITGSDAAQSQLTMTNMAMGTPDYVAPEQLELGAEPDHRADIFALGVMLYQMLTGQIPRGMFRLPSEQEPNLDPRLDHVVATAMQTNPGERYQQVTQLWTDVDTIRTTPLPMEQAETQAPPAAKMIPAKKKKPALIWAASGLLIVAAIAVLTIVANRQDESKEPGPSEIELGERKGPRGLEGSGPGQRGPGPGMRPSGPRPGGPGPKAQNAQERRATRQGVAMPDAAESAPLPPPAQGTDIVQIPGHAEPITGLALHPDGRRAVTSSLDRTFTLWDLEKGTPLWTEDWLTGDVLGVAFSPDGSTLAVAAGINVQFRETDTGKLLREIPLTEGVWMQSLDFSDDGKKIVAGGYYGNFVVLSVDSDEPIETFQLDIGKNYIAAVAFLPGGQRYLLVPRVTGAEVQLREIGRADPVKTYKTNPNKQMRTIDIIDEGRSFILGGSGKLDVYDIESGEISRSIAIDPPKARDLSVLPGGRYAVIATQNKAILFVDLEAGEQIKSLPLDSYADVHLAASLAARRVVFAGGAYHPETGGTTRDGNYNIHIASLPDLPGLEDASPAPQTDASPVGRPLASAEETSSAPEMPASTDPTAGNEPAPEAEPATVPETQSEAAEKLAALTE
ncbi:MAG: protein kinase, partial [Verrucomicrobiota bacterium]